ncbi:MAG TPA: type I-U CRISPR-associated protein Csx17 [Dermatophilaceae bacterium]|nr:type I-U CRISPR-associated protein Csx17 [Dermatophilaceae bacterium]
MTVHRCPGLPSRQLLTYLAALGLARVVSEQADPDVRFGWTGETFVLRTTVPDLVEFLVRDYRPSPVISPWNGGSGFGDKDKTPKVYLEKVGGCTDERMARFAATIAAAQAVLDRPELAGAEKGRVVQELRNWLPDEALPWLDASVILTNDKVVFPPLLGTGGNDGRLDFSTNFHQRLVDVIPELGAAVPLSTRWAGDLLAGASTTRLQAAAIGQFDAAGTGGPGSSAFGAADSRVNPWAYILMVEGLLWFASAAARRLGEIVAQAAMPFTVDSSPDGPIPGAPHEKGRGELWAPVVEAVTARHFAQLMREARASWQGKVALDAASMYGAIHTFGVDRGIGRFHRYSFLQRNGLAFVAVLLDTVEVRNRPDVALAVAPIRRAEVFSRAKGRSAERQSRAFNAAAMRYLREPTPDLLLDLLAAQTRLELAATRTAANRAELRSPGHPLGCGDLLSVVAPVLRRFAEARVAAGIASARTLGTGSDSVSMRTLLLGSEPGSRVERDPVVVGLGGRPLVEVLADLVVWRSQHPVADDRTVRGVLPFLGDRLRTPWTDVHDWASQLLDDDLVETYFMAFLAVDWRHIPGSRTPDRGPIRAVDPDLAVLQAFASGDVVAPGVPVEATDGRVGLTATWPLRLRAGQLDPVCRDAANVLGRNKVRLFRPSGPVLRPVTYVRSRVRHADRAQGSRLLAALCAPASLGPLRALSAIDLSSNTTPETSSSLDQGAFA